MRKYLRILMAFFVLATLVSVTVSADEYDSRWVSFLDYDTGGVNGNYLTLTSEASFDFTLPFVVGARSFQGLFMYNGRAPSSVYVMREGSITQYPCTILNVGNGLCRFYLQSTSNQLNDDQFSLHFVGNGTSTVINLLEFQYTEIRQSVFPEKGTLWVDYEKRFYDEGLEESYFDFASVSKTMSSATSPLKISFGLGSDDITWNPSFKAWLSVADWKKYDFIDFYFECDLEGIHSIVGYCGGMSLPLEVSLFDSGGTRYAINYGENFGYIDPYGDRIRFDYYDFTTTTFLDGGTVDITVRVDLRNIDRTVTDIPYVCIEGYESSFSLDSYIELIGCNGFIDYEEPDPLYLYLRLFANGFADVDQNLQALLENQTDPYPFLDDLLIDIRDTISSFQTGVVDQIILLRTRMDTWLDIISDDITGFRSSMESYLDELPVRIAEEVAKVFKPSAGKFESAVDITSELAEEKLGAVYQAASVIDQIAGAFTGQTFRASQNSISVPVVRVNVLPGVPFEFGGWNVSIVPEGFESIFETLKFVVDIVCTLAFLNGMKKRLDSFLGGESGVG